VNIQIFGTGALANEIRFGLLSNSYLSLKIDTIALLGASDSPDLLSKSILGMQDPRVKQRVYESLNPDLKARFTSLIHNSALVFPGVEIGSGTVINANSVISYGVKLGINVLVNWNVTIGHEVEIGSNTSIGPGSNLSGAVRIGNNCLLGAGVVVNPGVKIADGVRVGAGAVVTKDVDSNLTVVGVPARQTQTENQ